MSKKFIASIMALLVLGIQSTYAAQVASLIVEVSPSKTSVNQAVDLKVRAVDANGATVKDYVNTIFMIIPEIADLQDFQMPADSIYTFSPQDQGEVTFSKGLTVKVPGTFTIDVSDKDDANIKGQATLVVDTASQTTQPQSTITFSSPSKNGTETNSTISVVGNAGVKNSKVQILLDGTKVKEEQSNQNGDFTSYLTAVQPGNHTLKAVVQDLDSKILAQSEDMPFVYQPTQAGDIQSFDVLPSKTLKQGQKATFVVRVGGDTSSVELTLHDEAGKDSKLPLDKMPDGTFQKQLLMDLAGTYTIDVSYAGGGASTKKQVGIATVSVIDGKGIKEVTYVIDPTNKTKLNLAWKSIGDIDYVLVQKGTDKDTLNESVVLTGSTGQLIGMDVSKQSYYIRLFPSDADGNIIGEPSDIIMIEQVQGSAPVCRVQGIQVGTQKVGDQYFLAWTPAENAERYIIYRSDRPVNSVAEMQKVGETSDTKFPYPFDPQAKSEAYAYYAVVAVCQDGSTLQIDGTKQVKVGPMTNMAIVLLISMMVFGIYRMRKVNN